MSKEKKVRVINAAIAEFADSFVLRGVIDQNSFVEIKADDYQREEGSISDLAGLVEAFKRGDQIPDIEIGVRGGDYTVREGVHFIPSDCYVIDGLQRITAAKRALAQKPDLQVSLGAKFHFNTDRAWEKARFKTLNQARRRVSPNVLLRNDADVCESVGALYNMSQNDAGFVLKGLISWGQKMTRTERLTALSVLKIVGVLHCHFGPGLAVSIDQLMSSTDKTMAVVGPNKWRENIRTYFGTVDQAFGVRQIAFRDMAPWLKTGFLRALAMVFAEHKSFWDNQRLVIPKGFIDKLGKFPVSAPEILATLNGSTTNPILYRNLVAWIDSGKRTGHMVKWNGMKADGILSIQADANVEEVAEEPGGEPTFEESSFGK
jgi:hypothetical protein